MEMIGNDKVVEFWAHPPRVPDDLHFIYMIKCKPNNKVYIGKTSNPRQRLKEHATGLRAKRHPNKELQEDYNKYGDENFFMQVLACSDIRRKYIDLERNFILKFESYDPSHGYNKDTASRNYYKAKLAGNGN